MVDGRVIGRSRGVIGSLNFGLVDGLWLNWRPGGALRWKVETIDCEGRGVVCGKPAPPRL
jgi:hypothetical protein